jgi:hypothetical protein
MFSEMPDVPQKAIHDDELNSSAMEEIYLPLTVYA